MPQFVGVLSLVRIVPCHEVIEQHSNGIEVALRGR